VFGHEGHLHHLRRRPLRLDLQAHLERQVGLMTSTFVTAYEAWDGETTTVKVAIYRVGAAPLRITETKSGTAVHSDRDVQAIAERHLAERGLETTSAWTVAADPENRPGQYRVVFRADVGAAAGEIPCQRPGADPEDWFPVLKTDGVTPEAALRELEETAASLCAGCPVRESCLIKGMDQDFGVWGGEAPHQRRERRRAYLTGLAVSA
jgi:hypothetical protein